MSEPRQVYQVVIEAIPEKDGSITVNAKCSTNCATATHQVGKRMYELYQALAGKIEEIKTQIGQEGFAE